MKLRRNHYLNELDKYTMLDSDKNAKEKRRIFQINQEINHCYCFASFVFNDIILHEFYAIAQSHNRSKTTTF